MHLHRTGVSCGGAFPLLAAFATASVPCVATASPARAGPFQRYDIEVPGKIVYVADADVDGDGLTDLLVNHLQGLPPRVHRGVALFRQREGTGFEPKPDQVLLVPSAVALTGTARVEGAPGVVLLLMDGDGVRVVAYDAPSARLVEWPERWLAAPTLATWPEEEDLPFWRFARDWNGDGRDEVLVPGLRRSELYTTERKPRSLGRIALKLHSYYESRDAGFLGSPRGPRGFEIRYTSNLPALDVGEYDGDGRPDLFVLWEERLSVHRGNEVGGFGERAAARARLDPRDRDEKVTRNASVNIQVAEMNGDGLSDVLVTKVSGGLRDMKSVLHVHLNRRGTGFETAPDQTFLREGFSGLPSFAHTDGDRRLDLVLPSMSVGLLTMARVLVAGQMSVSFGVHAGAGRAFAGTPRTSHDVTFTVDYSRGANADGPYPLFGEDFTGDGRADLCAAVAPDRLAFYGGTETGALAERELRTLTLPLSRYLRAFRARRSGGPADLLLWHRDHKDLEGHVTVFVNRGVEAWR